MGCRRIVCLLDFSLSDRTVFFAANLLIAVQVAGTGKSQTQNICNSGLRHIYYTPPKQTRLSLTRSDDHIFKGSSCSRQLVNWCFEPSQPLRTTSRLKETFIQRHIVERTNKIKIKPEKQSEKTESCRETVWNEIHLKGP